MRRLVVALACLLLLGGAFPAAGEIYQWWDEQGKLHLSQDLNRVPSGPRTSTTRCRVDPVTGTITLQSIDVLEAEADEARVLMKWRD